MNSVTTYRICKRCSFECGIGKYSTHPIQGTRCEPLGKHLIPWTCAVFFHTAWNEHRLYFLTQLSKTYNGAKKVYSRPTWQTTIRWWIADAQLIAFPAHLLYTMYTTCIPANTTRRPNVGPMLGCRPRRWVNIGVTLGRCVVFVGIHVIAYNGVRYWLIPIYVS